MKRILITGAQGQLGRALYEQLKEMTKYKLHLTTLHPSGEDIIKKLDIADEVAVESEITDFKPDIIINPAAMTAVDLCETKQNKAYSINALGAKNIAKAASKVGAKLIHISTDYIYDGQAKAPYTEEEIPRPINVYGNTKLAGDNYVMRYCPDALVLHTGWLYGEGKNFVKTMLRLADEGKKIRVVSDQTGTPTSALELARTIVFLMEADSCGKYHATCEGSASWYEFALKIFEMAGKDTLVEAISTAEYPTPAKRPMYSVLDNKRLRERHGYYMKDWKEALKEYIDNVK